MVGIIILVVLLLLELSFMVLKLTKNTNLKKETSVAKIAVFLIFLLLVISPIITWSFRWTMLGLILFIQAFSGLIKLIRKKESTSIKRRKVVLSYMGQSFLIGFTIIPAILFPQFDSIQPKGEYSVDTVSYTLTDDSREEYFTEENDNRKVTIQFWYPTQLSGGDATNGNGNMPIVIFSHGAFGYRGSNNSTFAQLASHGYVVCSIDHTYQAFFTKQTDGQMILANMEFMNSAMRAQNGETSAEETYELQQEWMKLRTGDMKFVLNYIKEMATSANADTVFQYIDLEHIGVFGHSLGGATAAQIGREEGDVDAVIVVDGTMFGEVIGLEDGKEIIINEPYPNPIMNIYNESHYEEASEYSDQYPNMIAYNNALDSYQVVVKDSGHLNFTDLPLFSPFLAKLLGTGDIDAKYCIEATNEVILEFFDRHLKSSENELPKEQTLP